ncbi:MAG: hypothetical protein EBR53_06570 [Actinobacteria bacterium]|nr:hypothetical protein [Actinomycetota bacterium]
MSIRTRVGQGFDIHRFVDGPSDRVLVLGGVKFPAEKPLVGHSDADVIAHAAADALLGAAALGDIGMHFPDTDVTRCTTRNKKASRWKATSARTRWATSTTPR